MLQQQGAEIDETQRAITNEGANARINKTPIAMSFLLCMLLLYTGESRGFHQEKYGGAHKKPHACAQGLVSAGAEV